MNRERGILQKIEKFVKHPTDEQAQRRVDFFEYLIPDKTLNKITNNAIDINRKEPEYPLFRKKKNNSRRKITSV
jgi:hypothetical protein